MHANPAGQQLGLLGRLQRWDGTRYLTSAVLRSIRDARASQRRVAGSPGFFQHPRCPYTTAACLTIYRYHIKNHLRPDRHTTPEIERTSSFRAHRIIALFFCVHTTRLAHHQQRSSISNMAFASTSSGLRQGVKRACLQVQVQRSALGASSRAASG
jgi:hypothetical protein